MHSSKYFSALYIGTIIETKSILSPSLLNKNIYFNMKTFKK